MRATELRRELETRGCRVSLQAVSFWLAKGVFPLERVGVVSDALGLGPHEAAALYEKAGAKLPAAILALLPPRPQAAS